MLRPSLVPRVKTSFFVNLPDICAVILRNIPVTYKIQIEDTKKKMQIYKGNVSHFPECIIFYWKDIVCKNHN